MWPLEGTVLSNPLSGRFDRLLNSFHFDGDFRIRFVISHYFRYLHSPDPLVHRSTAYALNQLSANPDNCIAMHTAGVVQVFHSFYLSLELVKKEYG